MFSRGCNGVLVGGFLIWFVILWVGVICCLLFDILGIGLLVLCFCLVVGCILTFLICCNLLHWVVGCLWLCCDWFAWFIGLF